MKNKIANYSFGFLLVLAGCSSSETKTDKDSSSAAMSAPSEVHEGRGAEESIAAPAAPRAMTPAVAASALSQAVQSQNDDQIYKVATGILSQNPNDLRALNTLGLYHFRKNHLEAAQMMFARALKVDPNAGEVHSNMGLTYLAQKEKRDAIKSFRKSLELNPNDTVAAANIGAIYVQEQDYTKALVAMDIAMKKGSKEVPVLNNYGIALMANGKYSQAKDAYKQALAIQSSDKNVLLNYSILLIDYLKQYQDGMDIINRLKFLGSSPEARNRINALENRVKAGLK